MAPENKFVDELLGEVYSQLSKQTAGPALSRREMLLALGAITAATALPAVSFGAQGSTRNSAGTDNPRRIDVHHHFLPDNYIAHFEAHLSKITDPKFLNKLKDWSPALAIENMDQNDIETAVVSLPLPGVWTGDVPESRSLARRCNEFGGQMLRDFPGRFGLLAALPLPDVEGSLHELAHALDVLGADGISLLTSYGDKWTGDRSFDPVFEELNRRKAVVHVHPTAADCCVGLVPGVPPSVMEYLFDTARSISSLLVNGTFSRYPDIRFIFLHSGGTMPVLADRAEQFFSRHPELSEAAPKGVAHELNRLHYDIANATNPSSMAALMALVPVSQIFFGSDFPYRAIGHTLAGLHNLDLSAADLAAINRQNALRLFPRFAS